MNYRLRLGRVLAVVLLALGGSEPVRCAGQSPTQHAQEPPPAGARDEALRQELLRMMKEDQDARRAAIQAKFTDRKLRERMEAIDRKNTRRLKDIVARLGWPGKSRVGADGAHAAWLLVQHADQDPGFQKECLALMKRAARKGEVSAIDLAYLTDRVLVGEKKKQIYGTQFLQVNGGELTPQPIEDEANVDKRRKEVGLPPLAEYTKQLRQLYQPKGGSK